MNSICRGNNFFNDPDYFNRFIKNVESMFRKNHPFYNYYKSYLINDIGIDRCQINSNISIDIANLEMHHCILTLYDEVMMITKHFLRTFGYVNSFMVLRELIQSHKDNIIPIVILTETNHELYHKNSLFVPINLIFGDFSKFIEKYKNGITYPIIFKLKQYISSNIDNSNELLELNNKLLSINDWYNSIGGDNIDYINFYNNNNSYINNN